METEKGPLQHLPQRVERIKTVEHNTPTQKWARGAEWLCSFLVGPSCFQGGWLHAEPCPSSLSFEERLVGAAKVGWHLQGAGQSQHLMEHHPGLAGNPVPTRQEGGCSPWSFPARCPKSQCPWWAASFLLNGREPMVPISLLPPLQNHPSPLRCDLQPQQLHPASYLASPAPQVRSGREYTLSAWLPICLTPKGTSNLKYISF